MPRPRSAMSGTSLPAWDFNKVKPKSEVVQQAKKDSKSVHFASRSAQLICELIQRQCVPEFCGTGTSTICSRDEARLHQFGKKMLPRKVMRYVFVRGEDRQEICSSRIVKMSRTCQPPIVTSNGPSTQKSHKQCTRMSQARRYSSTPSRRNAHWGTPPCRTKERNRILLFSNEKTVKTFGAVVASSFAITQYIEESCTSHFISIRQCVSRTRTTPPNTR